MHNVFEPIVEEVTVNAAASYEKKIDLLNRKKFRLGIYQKFSAASTGLTFTLLSGMGPGDAVDAASIRYATDDANTVPKPVLAEPQGVANDSFTVITVDERDVSRFMNLKFENGSGVNCTQLDIWIDG